MTFKGRKRTALQDPELVRMLGDDPELLAIADALASTKAGDRRLRRRPFRAGIGAASLRRTTPRQRFTFAALGSVVALAGALAFLNLAGSNGPVATHTSAAPAAVENDGDAGGREQSPERPNVYMTIKDTGGYGHAGPTFAQMQSARRQARKLAAFSVGGSWTVNGPTNIGGRVPDLAVDPAHANTLYVASAGGGVWKSTDSGSTFTSVWPDSNVQPIGAIAVGPDGTLWAGTGESNPPGGGITYFGNGVYKSTDGGATWTNTGLVNSYAIGRIVVDSNNPNRVFVAASGSLYNPGGDRGIYHTTDGGASWQLVLAPPNDTTGGVDLAMDPSNHNKIFAALWDHKRTPCCRTYGGVGSGLYLTTDGGDNWARLNNVTTLSTGDATGLASSATLGRIGVAIAPSDPTRVYVVSGTQFGADKGSYFSNDGGATFQKTTNQMGGASGFQWWFGRIYVDPLNKDHVFDTDVNLRTTTGGGTGTWTTSSGPHSDQHAMAWDPNVPNKVYLGDDGGIYRSTTNGVSGSWTHGTFMPWNQGYHVDVSQSDPTGNRLVNGLQDNGCNRNTSGSGAPTPSTYSGLGSCGDGHWVIADYSNSGVFYSCSQNLSCSRTADTGSGVTSGSFGSISGNTRRVADAPIILDPNNPAVLYAAGNILGRSTNRGTNFTALNTGVDLTGTFPPGQTDPSYPDYGTITAIAPSKSDSNTIYIGTDTGRTWRTTDLGAHWTELTANGVPNRWVTSIVVDPTNSLHVYAAYSGYRNGESAANVFETTDGGNTWTNVSGNLPNAPVNMLLFDRADNMLLAANDFSVNFLWNPTNLPRNTSWQQVGDNLPPASEQDIKLHVSTGKLWVMTFGRGAWSIQVPSDHVAPTTTAAPITDPCPPHVICVGLTAADPGTAGVATTTYAVDGGAQTPYTAPIQVSGDGQHSITYSSTDNAGNVEATKTFNFTEDFTPPVTTLAVAPVAPDGLNGWYLTPPTFTLSASDATSSVASTEYKLDGGSFTAYSAPFQVSVEGVHTLQYRSTDTAGNVESTQSFSFKVDTSTPTSTASIAPSTHNGWYASPTVTLTGDDGAGSGIDHIEYEIDGGAFATYTGPLSGFSTGNHFVQFRAYDVAGRAETTTNLVAFKADAVQPTVTITAPADGAVIPLDKVTTAKFKCVDNQSGIDTCIGTVADGANLDTSTIGTHALTVTGTDKAGNVTTVTRHYTVAYTFNGFFSPISNESDSSLNLVHAGDLIKIGFGLNGDQGPTPGTVTSTTVACPSWTPHTVSAGGQGTTAGFSFGASSGHYTYGWQTQAAWAGTCRQLKLTLNDGTTHTAVFMFFA